jgi:predicted GH43/DUF377 family glycosyl hydrolase
MSEKAALLSETSSLVQRRLEQFQRDNARVIARYSGPEGQSGEAILKVLNRFIDLDQEQRQEEWESTRRRFGSRHRDLPQTLRRHFAKLIQWLNSSGHEGMADRLIDMEEADQLLAAAYVTAEYSVESAAFFNPAIVPHPLQVGMKEGAMRFIMTFRATGEGHISSVAFRSGVIDAEYRISLDPVSPFISTPIIETHRRYDKLLFAQKLRELKCWNAVTGAAIALLPDQFTRHDMDEVLRKMDAPFDGADLEVAGRGMRWLAESNYTITFDDEEDVCERVIFPVSPAEAHGIEDTRFVRFTSEGGEGCYYATYTAYSGQTSSIQLIETQDFQTFHMLSLNGPAVRDKGMALFPRKIGGDYVMLGRQDGRSVTVSRSRHLHFWYDYTTILQPQEPWELVKLGNCGSPVETHAGWIVLTHGVGAVRRYCIGAALLDLEDPTRVLGRLRQPLMEPLESEREGYVPNVVYTCGAMVHRDLLIIPYAMSDTRSGVASCKVEDLIDRLLADGP